MLVSPQVVRTGKQAGAAGAHFTCFTGTKVQILTHKVLLASTNLGAGEGGSREMMGKSELSELERAGSVSPAVEDDEGVRRCLSEMCVCMCV